MKAEGPTANEAVVCRRVAVLGAGPAGMSAALWLKHLGFVPLVIEAETMPGGMQRFNFLRNDWVLGQIGLTGPELGRRFAEHMEAEAIAIERHCRVRRIAIGTAGFLLETEGEDGAPRAFEAVAVIVATGQRYRGAEVLASVEGAETLTAHEVAFGPYAFVDLECRRGQTVLIVGCGDNAFENAKMLLESGAEAVLVCRSRPRAQRVLQEALDRHPGRWTLCQEARLCALRHEGGRLVASVETRAERREIRCDRLHVLAGYEPNTAFLREAFGAQADRLALDAAGFLRTDAWGRTSIPGLYAAGDVCNPDFPNVVSAIALGAKAAKAVELDLSTR